ncbi:MAG: Gfo/Idh/MocA family oxidoreductase [Actinocatenispora sp.]
MADRLRVGVLGCSAIAWRRTLPALRAGDRTVVTAVASRDADKAKRFATAFDCDATGYEELLARDDVDAVYLPLPTALHVEWGSRVLRAGKHLLVEKPAATTAAEARALTDLAAAEGLIVRENFTFLHHAQHAAVRDLVAAGRLGDIRSFSAEFCFPPLPDTDIRYRPELGGGALLDAGVYPIRAAQLLFGTEQRVAGAVLRMDPERGVDVAGEALLVSGTGVLTSIRFGFQHSYGSSYSLWGSTGRLRLDRAFTPPPSWQPTLRIDEQNHAEEIVLPPDDQFQRAIDSFATAALGAEGAAAEAEAISRADTVRTMDLVDQIRAAAVVIPAPTDPS